MVSGGERSETLSQTLPRAYLPTTFLLPFTLATFVGHVHYYNRYVPYNPMTKGMITFVALFVMGTF